MSNNLKIKDILQIKKMYHLEYEKIDSLSDTDIDKIEEKLNTSEEKLNKKEKNNILLENIIEDVISADNFFYPENKDWKILANIYKKVYSSIEEFLINKYKIIKNNKGLFGQLLPSNFPQYLLQKGNLKFFVKVIHLNKIFVNKEEFTKFINQILLLYKSSELGITLKVEEKIICNIKNERFLIIIYNYIDGQILSEWLKNHKLTKTNYQNIIKLLNIGTENNILVGTLNSTNIIVINKNKNIDFKLLDLGFEPTSISEIVNTKIKGIQDNIKFYKKNNRIHRLTIKKIIKEKIISLES